MKTKFLVGFMSGFFFLILASVFSCQETNQPATIADKAVLTQDQIVEQLNKLAYDLAADRSWITLSSVSTLRKTALRLDQTNATQLTSILKKEENGDVREYLITLETNGKSGSSNLQKTLDGGAYRVALDPDQFYLPEDPNEELWTSRPVLQFPSFLYTGPDSDPIEEIISHGPGVEPLEPIYFITLKDLGTTHVDKKSVIPGTYLAFYGLDLRYDTDNNNEEFELYLANGPGLISNPFNPTTTHMFDGDARNDASELSRNYPDINYIANGWNSQQEIALKKFQTEASRLTAIEDDQYVGWFVRPGTGTSNFVIDSYDMSDNYVKENETNSYQIQRYSSDADDRLPSAGVKNITQQNVSTRMSGNPYMSTDDAYSVKLNNVNWRLGIVVRN